MAPQLLLQALELGSGLGLGLGVGLGLALGLGLGLGLGLRLRLGLGLGIAAPGCAAAGRSSSQLALKAREELIAMRYGPCSDEYTPLLPGAEACSCHAFCAAPTAAEHAPEWPTQNPKKLHVRAPSQSQSCWQM